LVVGPPGCRAEPQVPIDSGLIGLWLRSEPVVLQDGDIDRSMHGLQLSEFALMNPLDSLDEIRDASPLRASLEYPLGLVDGIGKFLASFDGDAARFLAVDILAGLGGKD